MPCLPFIGISLFEKGLIKLSFQNLFIIIPSYQPQKVLVNIVSGLKQAGFSNILVVNDGSSPESKSIFNDVATIGATVLEHETNQGKGAALKSAFKFVLNLDPSVIGVVTCDADGQHLIDDVLKVSQAFINSPKNISLGSRHFINTDVPARSRFGNVLTRAVFRILIGKNLKDTQTGLRAIPRFFLKPLITLKTGGYEFELEMLIKSCRSKIQIDEIPIQTVYENKNESSHFNPFMDSVKIYFVFFRFLFSSLLSAVIDTTVFAVLQYLTGQLFLCMMIARITAGMVNFYMGRKFIFKSRGSIVREFLKYWTLVGVYLLVAYGVIRLLTESLHIDVYVAKISTETVIFIFSFWIQRSFIFAPTDTDGAEYDMMTHSESLEDSIAPIKSYPLI